jgi:hypothetical protein
LLASDQTLPSITAFADDLLGILLVLAFTAEGELILRLAIWDLVDTEPFVCCTEKAWKMTLDIFNVVQLGRERVVDLYRVSGMSLWEYIVRLTSMTIIFQSVSSSSSNAITPRTLTCFTWPV